MKHTESEKGNSKSKNSSTKKTPSPLVRLSSPLLRFVVCVDNHDYVDLEPRKVYRVRYDKSAFAAGMLRIIDDSDDDYLYPAKLFRPIYASPKLFQAMKRG